MSENPSNAVTGIGGSTWGLHLNKSNSKLTSDNSNKGKIKIQQRHPLFSPASPSNVSEPSFSYKHSKTVSISKSHTTNMKASTPTSGPRGSLKKRKSGFSLGRTKSTDFFNTLGCEDSLSQDSQANNYTILSEGDGKKNSLDNSSRLEKKTKSDPLARFESEISMDGDGFGDQSIFDSSQTPSGNNKAQNTSSTTRPLSFLGSIKSVSSGIGKRSAFSLLTSDNDSSLSLPNLANQKYGAIDQTGSFEGTREENSFLTPNNLGPTAYKRVRSLDHLSEYCIEDLSDMGLGTKRLKTCNLIKDFDQNKINNDIQLFDPSSIGSENECAGNELKESHDNNALDKDNWMNVENRLISQSTGKENKCGIDVYSLGFEEEEDVNNAKLAAAAGKSALLPLHDVSNTSINGAQDMQRERLLSKLQSGKANENYQKINLKKKVFVRGRAGRMTGAKYRRQEWKKKMDEKKKSEKIKTSESKRNKVENKENNLLSKKDDYRSVSSEDINFKGTSKTEPTHRVSHKKELTNINTLEGTGTTKAKTHFRNIKTKNRKVLRDDSFITEDEIEEYKPTRKKKVTKAKSKSSVVKKPRKNNTENTEDISLNVDDIPQNTHGDELHSEAEVWGNGVDDSELLNCFDDKGEVVQNNSNDEGNTPKTNLLTGIGTKVDPYYSSNEFYDKQEVLNVLQNKFGHTTFRSGQEEAIRRILCGHSTLVQLATGSGKSLVYQLPAYLYAQRQHCITLVVSPLVSLMEDQINGLPGFLRAACFHSGHTVRQREKVVEQIKSAAYNCNNINLRLHFLLVSPETLAGGGSLFATVIRHLPPIAFVCIDEAHCVSVWSHNFRPTYLRLCRVINERLKVTTLLGLTASAPESTIKDVAQRLAVCPNEGVIRGKLLPTNLKLSVSRGESKGRGKEGDLIAMLASEPFINYCSIIVYCTRRDTCEKLASIIRTHFQDRDVMLNKVSIWLTQGFEFGKGFINGIICPPIPKFCPIFHS